MLSLHFLQTMVNWVSFFNGILEKMSKIMSFGKVLNCTTLSGGSFSIDWLRNKKRKEEDDDCGWIFFFSFLENNCGLNIVFLWVFFSKSEKVWIYWEFLKGKLSRKIVLHNIKGLSLTCEKEQRSSKASFLLVWFSLDSLTSNAVVRYGFSMKRSLNKEFIC